MLIYKVTNKLNGKIYIGKTKQTLSKRKARHYECAKHQSDTNFHSALRKYPKDVFLWQIEKECKDENELNEYEIYSINKYDTYKNGYNMTEGGDGGRTYKKGDLLYEKIKNKLGKWKNGNPGATQNAIQKRIESFKKVNWPSGKSHGNYGKPRIDMLGKPPHNSKPVIIDTIEYTTTGEAAKALGIFNSEIIRQRCISSSKKWENYKYKN
jgi:group I intron endonuclease